MVHSCPYCDKYCTCKGDWDDFDVGHEPEGGCECNCLFEEDDEDDEFYDDFDDNDHPLNPPNTLNNDTNSSNSHVPA